MYSAKRLTFTYFSIIALSILGIHISVFYFTMEDIEHIYFENRLREATHNLEALLQQDTDLASKIKSRQIPDTIHIDKDARAFLNLNVLPPEFSSHSTLEINERSNHITDNKGRYFFIMKIQLPRDLGAQTAIIAVENTVYENSEKQLAAAHTKQIFISLALLLISLIAVLRISEKLTRPISLFTKQISKSKDNPFKPIPYPSGTLTTELDTLVKTFNYYQQQIEKLIQRERSFNAYASHELRTPLSVIKGVITLLGESHDPAFINKQRKRLEKSVSEMSDAIETLLELKREYNPSEATTRQISTAEIDRLTQAHQHYLKNKQISIKKHIKNNLRLPVTEAVLQILLGNLIKNAFIYSTHGDIHISLHDRGIEIRNKACHEINDSQGYGLGLLLVRDICHQYGWDLEYGFDETGTWHSTIRFQK